jgi:hypothetical protein
MHESSPVLPTRPAPSLNEAIRQFARWRSARQRGERIPVQLWRIAEEIARAWGVSKASQALHLDYYAVQRRLANETTVDAAAEATQFVELTLPTGGSPPISQCRLELRDRDGGTVRLDLSGWRGLELAAFVRSVTGRNAP